MEALRDPSEGTHPLVRVCRIPYREVAWLYQRVVPLEPAIGVRDRLFGPESIPRPMRWVRDDPPHPSLDLRRRKPFLSPTERVEVAKHIRQFRAGGTLREPPHAEPASVICLARTRRPVEDHLALALDSVGDLAE